MNACTVLELFLHFSHIQIFSSDSDGIYKLRVKIMTQKPNENTKNIPGVKAYSVVSQKENSIVEQKKPLFKPDLPKKSLMSSIVADEVFVDGLPLYFEEGKHILKNIQEGIFYRLDLPCYPEIWAGDLFVKVDLCVKILKEETKATKFEVLQDDFIVTESMVAHLAKPYQGRESFKQVFGCQSTLNIMNMVLLRFKETYPAACWASFSSFRCCYQTHFDFSPTYEGDPKYR